MSGSSAEVVLVDLQPFEFVAAQDVADQGAKKVNDSAGGLFAGSSGPKPPPALSTAVLGMKVGGKVITTPQFVKTACL